MVDFGYRELFLQDSVHKKLNITHDGGIITNADIYSESMELQESICSQDELRFGCCEASVFKIRIANQTESLKDKKIVVSEVLNENTDAVFQFGKYKVYSDTPTADRNFRDIVAYDDMHDIISSDMASWYNTILPDTNREVTLKEFRNSFIAHFGVEEELIDLINDNMVVKRTIDPTEISGKDIITAICEINGCFGHINRNGRFVYITIPHYANETYPSHTLYPAYGLHPGKIQSEDISKSRYISCKYEDYVTDNIDKLQIRKEESDIGMVIGNGNNCYIIDDNFLLYGKGEAELEIIGKNLFSVISKVSYTPLEASLKGDPCIEVGDTAVFDTNKVLIETYVLNRTMKGIQSLKDTFSAKGNKQYAEKLNSVKRDIKQLKGKTSTLTRTVEETRLEISNLSTDLKENYSTTETMQAEIKATAESIELGVSRTYETKDGSTEKYNNAISESEKSTDNKLKNYPTTETMQAAINISANEIESVVSRTYATQESVKGSVEELQKQIDGAIETFTGSAVPTLTNAPAGGWMTNAIRDTHIGDLYIVNASGGNYAGFYYRFEKNGNTYRWVLLKDTEITKALQEASDANEKAEQAKSDLEDLGKRVLTSETSIRQNSEEISLRAKKGEIISEINQSAEAVKINAKKIGLEGYTSINDSFYVDRQGNFGATSGEVGGWEIGEHGIYNDDIMCGLINLGAIRFYVGRYTYAEMLKISQGGTDDYPNAWINEAGLGAFSELWSSGEASINGDLYVGGTKSRLVSTENYGKRLQYCYEMTNPIFGDIGEGQIDETGKCYIFFDDIFSETIDDDCSYQVFLQPYGKGECYVSERNSSYFIVEGTEGLYFGWEIKAVQKNYDTMRLEEYRKTEESSDMAKEIYSYLTTLLYDPESEEF